MATRPATAETATSWAETEFRGVPGLEKRLQDRLVHTAATLAARPTGSLPQRFDWAELRAADRLVHAAADTVGPVRIVHDTTTLNFTAHAAVPDQLGPIGTGAGRGFLPHNSLAVAPERAGPARPYPPADVPPPTQADRRDAGRPVPPHESRVAGVGGRGGGGRRMPAGACWVHVGDRGADLYGMMAAALDQGSHFLIRLAQDRVAKRVPGPAG